MLRAVRFAARFEFELDADTAAAIREMAPQLTVVSAERIAAEMEAMLVDRHRARAMRLLRDIGLLEVVLPEVGARDEGRGASQQGSGGRGQGSVGRGQKTTSPLSPRGRGAGGEGDEEGARSEGQGTSDGAAEWEHVMKIMATLQDPTFALCLAVLWSALPTNQRLPSMLGGDGVWRERILSGPIG